MAYDIAVLGGGPAGVVTATMLARLGYRTALLTKKRRIPAVEGLSERALMGLRYVGSQQALTRIGPVVRRLACWNGERFFGNQEWLIERGAFDAALLEDARSAGVEVTIGRAEKIQRQASQWQISYSSSITGKEEWHADFLIDARGRAAPHGHDPVQRGPITIALGQFWTLPPSSEPSTQVTAFSHGWAWFARDANGTALLQLVVSAATQRLPPRSALTKHYRDLLTTVDDVRDWLCEANPLGEVFARYAQPQFNPHLLENSYARVGDAAFAIDPLSGHGIYEAIGGGLALAATVNTLFARPENSETAERFYRERINDDFLRMARIGRDFYRQEQRWAEQPFWRERQDWPDSEPAHAAPDASPPHIERRPVNAAGFIDLREVIVTPDHPRGIWQVAGVPLVDLLGTWRDQQGKPPIDIAWSYAERFDKPLEDCRMALAWLMERRLLNPLHGNS